jgi:hypothetical protein
MVTDFGGIATHCHDAVGAHGRGVPHQAIDGVAASFFQYLRVLGDLAALERPQTRHDVAAQPAAAHRQAKCLSPWFPSRGVTRDVLRSHDDHV